MADVANSDQLWEHAACGLLVTEANGTILRANATLCGWLGRPPAELVGTRLQALLSIGGRIFHQTHWAPLLKMQGSLAEVKLELLRVDGEKMPMVMNAIVRLREGIEYHELAIFSARDRHQYEQELVRARLRSEEILEREREGQRLLAEAQVSVELAMDAARLYQWSIVVRTRTRTYEPEVALLVGHPEPGAVDPAEFDARIVTEDRERVRSEIEAFLSSGETRFRTDFRLDCLDGRVRWIASWARLRVGADGAATHLVGILQDVTESQTLRALAEDRALLAEQTLGIVGHDLRNPLSAIQTGAELLSRLTLDPDQQLAVATRIQSSTRRANRLIADLLDFTQARNGRGLPLRKGPVDAHVIARDVVTEVAGANPSRAIRHTAVGEGFAVADGDRLIQALGNLLSNALTYGDKDKDVTITSCGDRDCVSFEVHNEGPPIPMALRSTLFEPMTRGENPGHLRSVGLGLYIVREIAVAHDGRVECESGTTSGTTFRLSLPR